VSVARFGPHSDWVYRQFTGRAPGLMHREGHGQGGEPETIMFPNTLAGELGLIALADQDSNVVGFAFLRYPWLR
jgi:hypothetical protein